jgi:hypothetical protein
VALADGRKTTAWLYYQPHASQFDGRPPVPNGDWKTFIEESRRREVEELEIEEEEEEEV